MICLSFKERIQPKSGNHVYNYFECCEIHILNYVQTTVENPDILKIFFKCINMYFLNVLNNMCKYNTFSLRS